MDLSRMSGRHHIATSVGTVVTNFRPSETGVAVWVAGSAPAVREFAREYRAQYPTERFDTRCIERTWHDASLAAGFVKPEVHQLTAMRILRSNA